MHAVQMANSKGAATSYAIAAVAIMPSLPWQSWLDIGLAVAGIVLAIIRSLVELHRLKTYRRLSRAKPIKWSWWGGGAVLLAIVAVSLLGCTSTQLQTESAQALSVAAASKRLSANKAHIEQIVASKEYTDAQQQTLLSTRTAVDGFAAQLAEYGLLGNLSADTLNNAIASAPYLLASYLDVAEAIRASKAVLDDNRQQFSAGEWYFVESAWTDAKAVNGYVVSRLGLAGDGTTEDAQRQQMMRDALELLPSVIQLGIALAK